MKKTLKSKAIFDVRTMRLEDREAPAGEVSQPGSFTPNTGEFSSDGGCTALFAATQGWEQDPNFHSGAAIACTSSLEGAPEFMAAGNTYAPNICYTTTQWYNITACVS